MLPFSFQCWVSRYDHLVTQITNVKFYYKLGLLFIFVLPSDLILDNQLGGGEVEVFVSCPFITRYLQEMYFTAEIQQVHLQLLMAHF